MDDLYWPRGDRSCGSDEVSRAAGAWTGNSQTVWKDERLIYKGFPNLIFPLFVCYISHGKPEMHFFVFGMVWNTQRFHGMC